MTKGASSGYFGRSSIAFPSPNNDLPSLAANNRGKRFLKRNDNHARHCLREQRQQPHAHIPGVNLGITAFSGANRAKRGTTVAPILRHGEKLTARFSEIAYGMTPMTESLWWVMRQMCLLHESRKIILIITDGKPDSIPAAQEVFKQAQKNGYGLRNKRNNKGINFNELV